MLMKTARVARPPPLGFGHWSLVIRLPEGRQRDRTGLPVREKHMEGARVRPWWLPGLPDERVSRWAILHFGETDDLALRVPALTAPDVTAVLDAITTARDAYLAHLPVRQIVA